MQVETLRHMGGAILTVAFAQVMEYRENKRRKGDRGIKVGLGKGETENVTKDTKACLL